MKSGSNTFWMAGRVLFLLLVVAGVVMSQEPYRSPRHFSGVINDYTPSNTMPPGPWEVRGTWSLTLDRDGDKASFSAALTMEQSAADPRMQHTHHITIEQGAVTPLPNGGFEVDGIPTLTKDGGPAPLQPATLHIQITGGTLVEHSNITLQFDVVSGGPTIHFGPQMLHGVVRKSS
jgi:hypothetical protein